MANPFVSPTNEPREVLLARHARQLISRFAQTFEALAKGHGECWEAIWNHPTFTPAEVWAALGDKGEAIMKSGDAVATILEAVSPGTIAADRLTSPQPYTVANGVVTLTPPAEPPADPPADGQ